MPDSAFHHNPWPDSPPQRAMPRRSVDATPEDLRARGPQATGGGARASVVNRTRRVIRDEALQMQQKRKRTRSLWAPLAICSLLLLVICYAIWGVMAGYDLTPTGIPDASDQMLLLLLLWSLPVTAVVLGLIWFQRGRGAQGRAGERIS